MKQGRSKSKGNKYENSIARIFSKWYRENYEPDLRVRKDKSFKPLQDYFWRTAGSGAKSTRGKSAQTSFTGDITFLPEPDRLQLWIDTKSVKNASFDNILSDGKFIIHEWYKEELKKAKAIGVKKPIVIIFKFYRKKENYIFYNSRKLKTHPINLVERGNIFWKRFVIMRLEDFLECVRKERILNGKS